MLYDSLNSHSVQITPILSVSFFASHYTYQDARNNAYTKLQQVAITRDGTCHSDFLGIRALISYFQRE